MSDVSVSERHFDEFLEEDEGSGLDELGELAVGVLRTKLKEDPDGVGATALARIVSDYVRLSAARAVKEGERGKRAPTIWEIVDKPGIPRRKKIRFLSEEIERLGVLRIRMAERIEQLKRELESDPEESDV